jgi:hypothetical protein
MPLALMRNFEVPQDATDYYLMSGDLRVGRIYERQGTQGLEFLWALTTVFFRETLRTIRLRHLADCVCRTATAAPSASVLNRGAQCRFHCERTAASLRRQRLVGRVARVHAAVTHG